MWKYSRFPQNIVSILDDPAIDEIIIINNDVNSTPITDILIHPKIKIYNFNENIYVNPAWNFGVSVARNELLAFLSDDVEFDPKIFSVVNNFANGKKNIGMIGVLVKDETSTTVYDHYYKDGTIDFLGLAEMQPEFPISNFGAFFFMLKQHWKPIPKELKIVNGECLQYNRCGILGKEIFMIVNCDCTSKWHVTYNTIPQPILDKDYELYDRINEHSNWANV